jgi:hypothetical protein
MLRKIGSLIHKLEVLVAGPDPVPTAAERVLGVDDPTQVRRLARRLLAGKDLHSGSVSTFMRESLAILPRAELKALSEAHVDTVEAFVTKMKDEFKPGQVDRVADDSYFAWRLAERRAAGQEPDEPLLQTDWTDMRRIA